MKIVAIGGGEIGKPGTKRETEPIDRESIRLTGKQHHILYFPIFQEGVFAARIRALAPQYKNLTYQPFLNFNALQAAATGVIIQYARES